MMRRRQRAPESRSEMRQPPPEAGEPCSSCALAPSSAGETNAAKARHYQTWTYLLPNICGACGNAPVLMRFTKSSTRVPDQEADAVESSRESRVATAPNESSAPLGVGRRGPELHLPRARSGLP